MVNVPVPKGPLVVPVLLAAMIKLPPARMVPPEYVFWPLNTKLPVPCSALIVDTPVWVTVMLPLPPSAPIMFDWAVLLTMIVLAPVTVPVPLRVMLLEPMKLILLLFSVIGLARLMLALDWSEPAT